MKKSAMPFKNLFVTGPPGCGKSTLIERIILRSPRPMTGFFTREIRAERKRVGFSINTLDGKTGVLAHEGSRSAFRVGRYGVNIEDINRIAVPSMRPTDPDQLIVIDEVGKMECLSEPFRQALVAVLGSANPVLASIAMKGDPFIQKIRGREDIVLLHLSEKNRNEMVSHILNTYFQSVVSG